LYAICILSLFVGPSVCLFVEKLAPVGYNFHKHGEEAKTHPLVEKLDDVSEYIPIRRMTKERVLALPNPIRKHCHESLGVCEDHDGLVVVRESSRARHAAANLALPDEPAPAPPPTLQHPPSLVSCR